MADITSIIKQISGNKDLLNNFRRPISVRQRIFLQKQTSILTRQMSKRFNRHLQTASLTLVISRILPEDYLRYKTVQFGSN